MIYFILLFSLLSNPFDGHLETNDKGDYIIEKLNQSKDTTDIYNLRIELGSNYPKYKNYFDYVPSINPVNPDKLTRFSSKFGRRFHPIEGKVKKHLGLDIASKVGTPVHASANGKVIITKRSETGCGNSVKIAHLYGFTTRYCHMYTFIVKKGQKVKKGDIIGFVGSTGHSTGAHLHYEMKKNDVFIDPYPFCFFNL